ncbi:chemotaxis protein CheW [Marinobacterium marinum]|uniref:Chemotaxis protein CheW n=1 Tax=Marinobacterium marinum TaxID=2756129 RepID=A0A7W1WVL1_9GAMM|nr:chemotaxis protein CheW [Marinobacterium marinum]MBA4501039.1 chemotaxis protein CheW [Marinobacterium marinum]
MADQKQVVYEYLEALLQDPLLEGVVADEPVVADTASAVEPVSEEVAGVAEPSPVEVPAVEASTGEELNCILVDMHGLKLAIPFDHVEGSMHLTDLALSLEGPDWMIGRFGQAPAWTRIVDTARWLIPERYKPEYSRYLEVVILKGRRWALACDGLVQSVRIPVAAINRHQDARQRTWLLGTYMPERCAILDIEQLLLELEAACA